MLSDLAQMGGLRKQPQGVRACKHAERGPGQSDGRGMEAGEGGLCTRKGSRCLVLDDSSISAGPRLGALHLGEVEERGGGRGRT